MKFTPFSVAGLLAAFVAAPACLNPAVLAGPDAALDARDGGHDLDDHVSPVDGSIVNVHIDGTIEAMNEVENAQTAAGFETRFTLRIARDGSPIGHASVVVTGGGVTSTLAQIGGTFVGSLRGYAASYTLDIDGDVTAHGVALAGPAFHVFTAPTAGQTVATGTPLTVTWSPAGAQAATIESDQMPEVAITDSGSYTIADSFITGEAGRLEPDRIRVRRRNLVNVPGVAAGSVVEFEVRNEVGIQIDAR